MKPGMKKNINQEVIDSIKDYINTYEMQYPSLINNTEHMFIEDMLYGIGIALDSSKESYSFVDGFDKFKLRLLEEHMMDVQLPNYYEAETLGKVLK